MKLLTSYVFFYCPSLKSKDPTTSIRPPIKDWAFKRDFSVQKSSLPAPISQMKMHFPTSLEKENNRTDIPNAGSNKKSIDGPFLTINSSQGKQIPKFPINPWDFSEKIGSLPTISKTRDGTLRMRWKPNNNTRIRYESHPDGLTPKDDDYCPRHHGNHYHIEKKPTGMSWQRASKTGCLKRFLPIGYIAGNGTGFIPGDDIPGEILVDETKK